MSGYFENKSLLYNGGYNGVLIQENRIQEWEAEVESTLKVIQQTQTGRALLRAVSHSHRTLLIVPDPDKEFNAHAKPVVGENSGSASHDRKKFLAAKDSGSNSIIEFSPGKFISPGKRVGASGDAILCHEICHALHDMMGRSMAGLPADHGFKTGDEFWAILLANIYLSEKHLPLRRNHEEFSPLEPWLCSSAAYYHKFALAVDLICQSTPAFTRAVADVPADFNPLHEYYARHR